MSAEESLVLEQYTGVAVALDEGLPLDAILAAEGLSSAAWQAGQVHWKERLATDGAEGPLFGSFREKRAAAEDCLTRKVAPIDGDLAAWMSFLAAFSKSPDAFAMLGENG